MTRSRTCESTNDIDAGLATTLALKYYFGGALTRLALFLRSLFNLATISICEAVLLKALLSMGDSSAKKRKRAQLEREDPDPKLRAIEDAVLPGTPAAKRPKKDGKSRQEKSERRSSKKQKREAGGDNTEFKPERAHKKTTAEEPDTDKVIGNTIDRACELPLKQTMKEINNNPTAVSSHANDATNGAVKERGKKKSRTTVATTRGAEAQVTSSDSTTEGHNTSKPQRFILFIGNLPYSATTSQIEAHFSKLAPTSIRHSTDKSTGRSKGFAFLEFTGYDKMKTCLKLYHHSIFDPGDSKGDDDNKRNDKKKPGRRINVELTVGGGGGRSEKRKEKIKGKNLKLEEERERRRVKDLENSEKQAGKKSNPSATDANATLQTERDNDMGDIHPSRRGRVG